MSNPTHQRLAKVAQRLIAKNGCIVELLAVANNSDAVSDTDPFGNVTDSFSAEPAVTVIKSMLAVEVTYSASEVNGVQITSKDTRFLCDGTFEPTDAMRLRADGTDYSIVSVEAIKPGEVVCAYFVQARNG